MFRGIFNKREADSTGKRQLPGASTVPTSADETVQRVNVVIDDSLLALSRELSALKQTEVPRGAKERGWASLQREMERKPVRPAVTAGAKSSTGGSRRGPSHTWRWALGGAAGAIAVAATLVATLTGGGVPQVVVNDSTTITSVVSTGSTLPGTTETTPVTTGGSSSTNSTQPTTQSTDTTPTSGDNTTVTTDHTTVTNHPSTTQPTSTDTTGEQQNAAAQREKSAKTAVNSLGILAQTGNTSGSSSLIAPSAQDDLAQMVRSLDQPYGFSVPNDTKELGDEVVRVTLDVNDRIVNGRGELVETVKHFFVQVRVDKNSAVIIAINAGS
jgi:hypothetical protein